MPAAVAIRSGYMPTRSAPLKIIATATTIGLGGSVGREGPIVQIGGAIGSAISRRSGMGEDRVRSMVAAGAGALEMLYLYVYMPKKNGEPPF